LYGSILAGLDNCIIYLTSPASWTKYFLTVSPYKPSCLAISRCHPLIIITLLKSSCSLCIESIRMNIMAQFHTVDNTPRLGILG